jgi:3-phosphoshikimate 1-carboxyvinyltransferase
VGQSTSRYRTEPVSGISGKLTVPGDKSISHRAIMLAALAEGRSRITGFLRGEDCLATLAAFRSLGVRIEETNAGEVVVEGTGMHGLRPPSGALDLGNSGTAMRLMAGVLAGQPFEATLVGDASLMQRPMERVAVPLRLMGAEIETRGGKPPVRIRGARPLAAIDYAMPIASAQVKSAVLLAGLYARGQTIVRSPGITRDHTERMLRSMGADVHADLETGIAAVRGPAQLRAFDCRVPGDFSSAAFFIVGGLVAADPSLTIENVGLNPTRTGLLEALRLMGAQIEVTNERQVGSEPVGDLVVHRSELHGIDVPVSLVALAIDEFPILFVAAAMAEGVTRVRGAEELRHKESDRIAVMAKALRAVGVEVDETEDGMDVRGGSIRAGTVDSGGDHRVAMAMAIAGARSSGPIEILDTANVATSFPGFVSTAKAIGFGLGERAGRE